MAGAMLRELVAALAGGLIQSDYVIQLGPDSSGLLLGAGTPYDIVSVAGWDELPPFDSTDVNKPTSDGAWAGPMYAQGRTITVTLQVAGTIGFTGTPTIAQYAANVAALRRATNPQSADTTLESPFVVQLAGQQFMASVRCQKRGAPIAQGYASPGTDQMALQFFATDPRRYDLDVQSATTGLYASTGGLHYPITYPLTWGAITSPGAITIVNDGDTFTPPVFTITGGGNTPSITRQDTGETLMIDLALQASDTLVVDVLNDQLLLDGSTVYALDPSSDPISSFFIAPGSVTVGLSVASGTGTQLAATWQSAYL